MNELLNPPTFDFWIACVDEALMRLTGYDSTHYIAAWSEAYLRHEKPEEFAKKVISVNSRLDHAGAA